MNKKSTKIVSALTLSLFLVSNLVLVPAASARGGFGGFGGGGGRSFGGGGRDFSGFGGGGGGRSFGGGGRDFGGGGRDFGGGNRDFGGGGRDFGGGGRDFGGGNRDFGGGGRDFGNSGISTHPISRDGLPTDGGLGGFGNFTNRANHPTPIDQGRLNNQGNKIRDNFNNNNRFSGNDINNINNNSVNFNHYGNNYGFGHGYGYGYGGYGHWGPYGYPGGWYCPGWSQATAWTCMGMTTLTSFLGMGMMGAALANSGSGNGGGNSGNTPSVTNITYEGDNVYYNGQPQGSASDYYQQAQKLANNGTATTASADDSSNWQPLGVFALAEPGQTDSNMMLQMAINKDGMVRGNYLNQLTNETSQVFGALDKKTQRVSWTIGNNNTTVFDAMLGDLVKNDSSVLVHYGPTNTKTMALIRLPAPQGGGNGDSNNVPSGNNS